MLESMLKMDMRYWTLFQKDHCLDKCLTQKCSQMRTPNHWQNNNLVSRLLMPLGWIYFQLSLWRHKIARCFDIGVPVICVGNIVAGGAGKTPTAMYLGKLLSNVLR